MTAETSQTRTDLVDAMDRTRIRLLDAVKHLGERLTIPTDAAGWTGKDHIIHLTAWERAGLAILRGEPRHEALGIDEAVYLNGDIDAINAVIQADTRDMPLRDVFTDMHVTRQRLREALAAAPEEDLHKPASHFLPDDPTLRDERTLLARLARTTGGHVDAHIGYIEAIAIPATRDGLLAAMDESWGRLQAMYDRLDDERLSVPTDAAGWNGRDHLTHLVAWEGSLIAVLLGRPRHEALGVDEALYLARDYDTINGQIRETMRNLPVSKAWAEMTSTRDRLRAMIAGMSDAEVQRPYWTFLPGADPASPPPTPLAPGMDWSIARRIHLNACLHVEEHIDFIDVIAATPRDRAEALAAMDLAWSRLDRLTTLLGEELLTGPTDAAGWIAKDHLTHLAAWERSMLFLFRGRPRHEGLGVAEATYARHDVDAINAEIRANTHSLSFQDAMADLRATHEELRAVVADLTDNDLQRPYSHFLPDEPGTDDGRPIIDRLNANGPGHFAEHIGYIEAIVAGR